MSRKASEGYLLEVVGRFLSLEEIKRETRRIMARRPRGRRERRFGSPRLAMGLIVLVIVVSTFYVSYLGSAPPQHFLVQEWERSLGTGEFEGYPYVPLGAVDAGGNLYVAATLADSSLTKFGSAGDKEWRRTFVIEQGSSAVASCITVEAEARHIFVGGVYINSTGWHHGFLACFDSFGEVAWVLDWGRIKYARSVCAANGSVYVAGIDVESPTSRAFIAKYDSEGNMLWNATSGADGPYDATAICCDGDGNVFVVVLFDQNFLIKYDSAGNEVWNSTWDYQFGSGGELVSVEGAYVYVLDPAGWLNKHSIGNGTLIWRKPLGWDRPLDSFYVDTIALKGDGGIDVGGVYERREIRDGSLADMYSVCVVSLNADGERIMNATSLQREGNLYVGSMFLDSSGSVRVVGAIPNWETSEWEFVLMQLRVMSRFLAGTALTVSLATISCIILAVIRKEICHRKEYG
jgi:hypothetical protein